jgi:DNA mismatch repair protein MutL
VSESHRIQVLPDRVINQIAAGEVVQRPSSVLKELLENAVDSGANLIQVSLKDAGRSLIEVMDNGKGIPSDQIPLALQRHATSKIVDWEDLYRLNTYGFRGEALASIASVSHIEVASRVADQELGVLVEAQGGAITQNQPSALPLGTRVSVRSLFFNVPARRNFLKKDSTESKNLEEEFIRLALARPDLALELKSQGQMVYSLKPGNLRQRIQAVLGKNFADGLVPVEEDTQLVGLSGFVAKPALCRKTRYAQYLFVNGRYFKDAYLQHAVSSAMEGLLPAQHYPAYVLNFRVDPSKMDVNVHPSKIEVKFEEDQGIYAILKAAVRRSLGQYQLQPSLDFEWEPLPGSWGIQSTPPDRLRVPSVRVNPDYNPFGNPTSEVGSSAPTSGYHRLLEGLMEPAYSAATPSTQDDHLQDGWIYPDGTGLFRTGQRMVVVEVRVLLREIMMDRLIQNLDQVYRPGHGVLPLEPVLWQGGSLDQADNGLPLAASLGIELRRLEEKDTYQVETHPAHPPMAEVLDLLDWIWARLHEGGQPVRSEALGYLARTRGLNGEERPFDPTNPAQVMRALKPWVSGERTFLDPEGRPWGWCGEPKRALIALTNLYEHTY